MVYLLTSTDYLIDDRASERNDEQDERGFYARLISCTKDQFIEEVKAQLLRAEGLDVLLKQANQGRGLKDFSLLRVEVWHEWQFSAQGIQPKQPKWVMSQHT